MSATKILRAAAALAVAALLAARARADLKVGDAFPALAPAGLVNLAGGDIPEVTGQVTLVDFWASWCAPCKASFPAMAKLYAALGPRGFRIIAVSVDEKPADAVSFWKRLAPPFITLRDRQQKLVQEVSVPTMPTSYLLDRHGRVRFVHSGFHGDLAELQKEVEQLLDEKS